MPLKGLAAAAKKSIGTKQTLKAIDKGIAKRVFIAEDADGHVVQPLIDNAKQKGIPVINADTMKNLGKICGIEVGCAAAAILEE